MHAASPRLLPRPSRYGKLRASSLSRSPSAHDQAEHKDGVQKNKLVNSIRRDICEATEERVYTYEDVDIEALERVAAGFDRGALAAFLERKNPTLTYNSVLKTLELVVMPSKLHNCPLAWLNTAMGTLFRDGFFTPQEWLKLRVQGNSRFSDFGIPYRSSRKEPDGCILPAGMSLPTLVIESGLTESRRKLHRDRDLWLQGGAGSVQVVLVAKWTKDAAKKIRGDIEVFDLGPMGTARSLQKEVIFPAPPAQIALGQTISLTKRHLFGSTLPAVQDPGLLAHLDLNLFREIADEYIRCEDCVPAS